MLPIALTLPAGASETRNEVFMHVCEIQVARFMAPVAPGDVTDCTSAAEPCQVADTNSSHDVPTKPTLPRFLSMGQHVFS